MKVLLITGSGGSGKSTIVRKMSNFGYSTFHSSAVIKKQISDFSKISETSGKNLEAPTEFDSIVEKSLLGYLKSREDLGEKMVVVEAVPRTLESISMVETINSLYDCCSVMLHSSRSIRTERLSKRGGERAEFDKKRLRNEDPEHFQKLHELLLELSMTGRLKQYMFIDTDHRDPKSIISEISGQFKFPVKNDIQKAMASALNGFHERNGYSDSRPPIERMVERTSMELSELICANLDQKNGQLDLEDEYADVLHFVFCLGEAIGISPDRWFEVFNRKTKINQARAHFNVTKENKHDIKNGKLYEGDEE